MSVDMHPGNILVGQHGDQFNKYIGLDYGIVGSLNETDKNYLAQNFLAFFRRDYRRIAELHVDGICNPACALDHICREHPEELRTAAG